MKIKWLCVGITIIMIVGICERSVEAAAVKGVIGMSADMTIPPPPSGLCSSGTFAMSQVGVLSLIDNTNIIELGLGSLENSYDGFAYVDTRTSTSDTRQAKIDMNLLSNVSSGLINTVDVPDATNQSRGSHYNTFTGQWTVVARKNTGVECGGTTCIHIRTYAGGTNTADVLTSAPSASGPQAGSSAFDSTFTYILSNTSSGQDLRKLNTSAFTVVDAIFVESSGTSGAIGLALDTIYIYAPQNVSARILRYLKSNVSGGATGFTPGLSAGTLQLPAISTDGFLYIPTRSAGVSPNVMYRVRTSDMTIQGTVSLGATQFLGKVLVDEVNNKLYLIMSTTNTQLQIVRVDRTTLAIEETYSGLSNANGPNMPFVQIDVPHQKIYSPQNGDGAANVARLEKINLCS